jgi:hypothetical protein
MAKTCPSCNAEIAEESKKTSTWAPILAAVGVSAAAYLVYHGVKKVKSPEHKVESALARCARAAQDLDRRIDDSPIKIAS